MSKPKVIKPYTNVKIVNSNDTWSRVKIGLLISVLSFVAITIFVDVAQRFGMCIPMNSWTCNSCYSEVEYNSVSFWNRLGCSALWVLYWVTWPLRLILGLIAHGSSIIFG